MQRIKSSRMYLVLISVIGILAIVGCSVPGAGTTPDNSITVVSTSPAASALGVAPVGTIVTATFSKDVDPATMVAANFTVTQAPGAVAVPGAVTYDVPSKVATFTPTHNLSGGSTVYTATITTAVKDLAGTALAADKVWSFTTTVAGLGPVAVNLGTAGTFALLAKASINNIPTSVITGDVGLSPAAESFMTGFAESLAVTADYATSTQVTGFVYAADMAPGTPAKMTAAINDMATAYADAAGRTVPDHLNIYTGALGGQTLSPGLYKWTTAVSIATDVTLSGGAADVWIFQVTGAVNVAAAKKVILSGGAQAKNIFWQVTGTTTLGAGAHFEGIILDQTIVTMGAGASLTGRALAQTQIVMSGNTVTQP